MNKQSESKGALDLLQKTPERRRVKGRSVSQERVNLRTSLRVERNALFRTAHASCRLVRGTLIYAPALFVVRMNTASPGMDWQLQ